VQALNGIELAIHRFNGTPAVIYALAFGGILASLNAPLVKLQCPEVDVVCRVDPQRSCRNRLARSCSHTETSRNLLLRSQPVLDVITVLSSRTFVDFISPLCNGRMALLPVCHFAYQGLDAGF
jgi:hypothetical protein